MGGVHSIPGGTDIRHNNKSVKPLKNTGNPPGRRFYVNVCVLLAASSSLTHPHCRKKIRIWGIIVYIRVATILIDMERLLPKNKNKKSIESHLYILG